MSLFDRLRGRRAPSPAAPRTERAEAPGVPPEATRLARFGAPDGPDEGEAIALLAALATSPAEGRALEALAARGPLPEALAAAAARAFAARGDAARAAAVLGSPSSAAGLLLAADFAADAGDPARALALVERVLLRDLDVPGARERHARLRARVGDGAARAAADDGATRAVTKESSAPFALLREVARGGAGTVYEGEDREFGRRVAVKVYHRPARDAEQLVHEARVAVALAGAGVVRVLDLDPEAGWIALEWAAGGALRDAVRARARAVLAPPERWAGPLAAALGRVHAAGWVHNDVKPANVLLDADGAPALTDFGTARRAGEPAPPGSLGYVSPERLRGRASDPADDVYGFGRALEDALDALDPGTFGAAGHPMRRLAAACTGPDDTRPRDGAALMSRLRAGRSSL